MMYQELFITLIVTSLAFRCVKTSPATLPPSTSAQKYDNTVKVLDPKPTISTENKITNDDDDSQGGDNDTDDKIYESYGLDDVTKDTPLVDDSEIVSNNVLSMIDKDNQDSSMSLSDDVIIDALFTNIDTVQDQMELCEEGLRHKLLLHGRKKLLNVNRDDDYEYDYEDYDALADDYDHNAGNDESKNNKQASDYLKTQEPTATNDKKNEDESNDEAGVVSIGGKTRQRRCVNSDSGDDIDSTLADIVKNPGQAIVKRLSSRLEHLKNSLRECYVLYKSFK